MRQPGLYEIYDNFYDFVGAVPPNNGHYYGRAATEQPSFARRGPEGFADSRPISDSGTCIPGEMSWTVFQ
jgi:hypothetical protein